MRAIYFFTYLNLKFHITETSYVIIFLRINDNYKRIELMNIFPELKEATANRDFDKFSSYIHEEYTFIRHQSGTTMNREETLGMIKGFLASDSFTIEQHRCVYENEDILVEHMVVAFPDNTKEAVLAAYTKKDNKLFRCETGATKVG